ncbi:uncharacterized protein LOC131231125 [Magnolia sinica]|uniref:uncharacterized protein LOC131231125 n=1 Tax=Magnolia sinica TaxID=86752 RepID=UPI00265971E3|nr:uncharacterized protein LOC131231125 [Magnolia sinica]
MMKERFKDYRNKLHWQYKRCMSHKEAIQSAPLHVIDEDWRILCDRFSSDSFQKRSKINSDNRGKLKVNHVAGSKSFVRLRHDMRDSVTGQEPGPVDSTKGLTVGRQQDLGYILEQARFGRRWTPYAVSPLPMVLSGVSQRS